MNIFIRAFLIAALVFNPLYFSRAQAQTATLLPNGMQQFFDDNGNPLTSGTVGMYIPNTTSAKTTWQDAGKTILNTNPVPLDAAGRALIYGDGIYRQILRKSNGDQVWDQLTASTGSSGGGGTTIGDGNSIGTILSWAGLVAPTNYLFAFGQELNRADYPNLYSLLTNVQSATCTSLSATLTNVIDTTQIPIGADVENICFAPNTTVVSKTSNSVTVSNPSNITTTVSTTFFAYGNGNGSTTFNIPDLRGRVVAGRDNMGGSNADRITVFNARGIGAVGGSQEHTLTVAELVPHVHTQTAQNPTFTYTTGLRTSGAPESSTVTALAPTGLGNTLTTTGDTTPGTTLSSGNGDAFPTVQPTITTNYIIKVKADINGSLGSFVSSIGGMIGDITCSGGIVCTGQSISTNTGGFVTLNGVETLTNKTLTAPILTTPTLGVATATSINGIGISGTATATFQRSGAHTLQFNTSNNATVIVPGTGGTMVNTASTQTLTNKTLDAASNTITNVSLTTGVSGNLPVTNLNSGTLASSSTYWRGDATWSVPAGGGDVVGPASAVTDHVATFSGTTGKIIKDSGILISSGTYTPTATNVGGNVVTPTTFVTSYMRLGDTVTVGGRISLQAAGTGAIEVGLTIPVASNFGSTVSLGGTFCATAIQSCYGAEADSVNDRATIKGIAVDTTNRTFTFTFVYHIN